MIVQDGQFVFDIAVGKYKDFLNFDDLVEFTLFEEAGCVLPSFDLIFKFNLSGLRNYLVENNQIQITFGKSANSKTTLPFRIYQKNIVKYGQSYWLATVHGFYDAIPFIKQTATSSYQGTATEVLQTVTSPYFKFQTNVQADNSYQFWLQCKKTSRDFATDVWLHSNIPNSFAGVAITKDGTFVFNDMIKAMSSPSKWTFSYNRYSTDPSNVLISGSSELLNDTGVVNSLTQNKTNIIYNMDDGSIDTFLLERNPLLASTSNLDASDITVKNSINYKQNSNVHDNYWQSYCYNLGQLTFFSGVRAIISYNYRWIDNMQVLDIAHLLDQSPSNASQSEGLYSGKYIISKIVRTINNARNLQTHVVLSREALNEVRDVVKDEQKQQIKAQQIQEATQTMNSEDYTLGATKLLNATNTITQLVSNKGFSLTLPTFKILADELNSVFSGFFGINEGAVWMKIDYLLTAPTTANFASTTLNFVLGNTNNNLNSIVSLFSGGGLTSASMTTSLLTNILGLMGIPTTYGTVSITNLTNITSSVNTNLSSILLLLGINTSSPVLLTSSIVNNILNLMGIPTTPLVTAGTSLITTLLSLAFTSMITTGQTVSLSPTSSIINQINSPVATFTNLIDSNGNLNIPNVGSTPTDATSFTANVFSWYTAGIITPNSTNTGITTTNGTGSGDYNLDSLLNQTITYLVSGGGIVNQITTTDIFKCYWGSLTQNVLNAGDINLLYSKNNDRVYLNKNIKCNSSYIYILYPYDIAISDFDSIPDLDDVDDLDAIGGLGALVFSINGNIYNNFNMTTQNINVGGTLTKYVVFRTNDRFSSSVNLIVEGVD